MASYMLFHSFYVLFL
jgi:hypothetical protein